MKKLFPIIAMLLLAASCEIPFELDRPADPCIYMQCIVQDRGGALRLQYAAPIGSTDKGSLQNVRGQVTADGEEIPLFEGDTQDGYRFYLDEPVRELSVSLQADGLPSVSGSTRIPDPITIVDVQLEPVQVDTIRATRVSLTLAEAPGEDDFFGLVIERNTSVLYADGTYDLLTSHITPGYVLSAADIGTFDLADFVQVDYDWDRQVIGGGREHPMTLVTQKHFDGATYSFYLNSFDRSILDGISGSMPSGDTGVAGGGIVSGDVGSGAGGAGGTAPGPGGSGRDPGKTPVGMESDYYFGLFHLSESFYYYALAQFQSNFDFLANMGLVPANFTWSNVQGGLGVVGALTGDLRGPYELPAFPEEEI